MGNGDEWITVDQAAKLTGYNQEHIRRLLREGLIAGQKFGIVWQVSRSSVISYSADARESEDRRHGPKKNSPE